MPPSYRRAGRGLGWVLFGLSFTHNAAGQQVAEPDEGTAVQESASCNQAHYVVLRAGTGFDQGLAEEVHKDLEAELGARGFCVLGHKTEGSEWAADILLDADSTDTVSIQVDDFTTGKRVSRDVSLTKIPAGGVALAIAIATDELLRASWAELWLRDREKERAEPPPPPRSPPPSVQASVQPSVRPPPPAEARSPRGALFLVGGFTHTASAWDAGGLALRGQRRVSRWGFLEASLGAVKAHDVSTPYGDAGARGISASLTGGACLDVTRLHLCGGPRLSAQWLSFRGQHAQGAKARRDDLVAVLASGVLELSLDLGARLRLLGELGLGGALHGAEATDGQTTLLGLSGFVLSAGLGFGVLL